MNKIVIVGGGIGGLLLAEFLMNYQVHITVLDDGDPLKGSGSPNAIMHPFPGRSVQPHPLLKKAFLLSQSIILDWKRRVPNLVNRCQITRPLEGESGKRLLSSFQKHWAESKEHWVTFQGDMTKNASHMTYGPAYAVNLEGICKHLKSHLIKNGVFFSIDSVTGFERTEESWAVIGKKSQHMAHRIVLALGSKTDLVFPNWGSIEGGDLIVLKTDWPRHQIIAHNGIHLSPASHENSVAVGATRWPNENPMSTMEAEQRLRHKSLQLDPNMSKAKTLGHWRGKRAVWKSDRLPTCGVIPNHDEMFALLGLGGKGLLWGPLAAKSLANNIMEGHPIPKVLSTTKVKDPKWASPLIH